MQYRFQFTFFVYILSLFLIQVPLHSANEPIPHDEMHVPQPISPNHDISPHPNPEPIESDPFSTTEIDGTNFMSDFIKMLSTLGLLIGFLLFVSWYLKRLMQSRVQQQNTSSSIKVLEQRQLSARATIHIVEIEGKVFAIGESTGNICLLSELPSSHNHE